MKINHKIQLAGRGMLSIWLKIGIVFLFLINFPSCHSPEDLGQENFINTPFIFHFENGSTSGSISFDYGEDLKYQVVLAPKWIHIDAIQGKTLNGKLEIPFEFNNVQDYMDQGDFISGALIVRVGYIGLFSFTVSYGNKDGNNPGPNQNPLVCNVSNLIFESEDVLSFTLINNGMYGNSWQAVDVVPWLKLSESSGYISGGNQATIQCRINKEGLPTGEYSQYISIVSTNPSSVHGILVKMKVDKTEPVANNSTIKWINGKIKDAHFSKTTNYLYLLTQNPNRLLYKLPESDSLYSVSLSKVPNCIDVSKDGKTLAIGYNQAAVDIYDAQTFELKRSYETDCIPWDIILGENDWCYVTSELGDYTNFYSLNLKTGVTFRAVTFASIYQKTVIVKAPDKPLLYATRPQLSPEGVLIINIAGGAAKDTIPGWHEETGGKLWPTPDGKKLIAANKKIFKTPDYTTNTLNYNLPVVGTIDIPRNAIRSLDFCETLNCYFAAGSDYFWTAFNAETIYQLDAESFSAVKSIKVQPFPGSLTYLNYPPMDVHHIFSNKQGTKLFAVKNAPYNLEMDKWALEIIDLPLK
jgi:hypothetical protein